MTSSCVWRAFYLRWPRLRLYGPGKIDLETMSRIRYEGFHDSKVMDYATGLMDSIGERLTGSLT